MTPQALDGPRLNFSIKLSNSSRIIERGRARYVTHVCVVQTALKMCTFSSNQYDKLNIVHLQDQQFILLFYNTFLFSDIQYRHLGCYHDVPTNRDLNGVGYSLSVITLNTCAGLCAEEGFPFVGLQGMQQCFCGSSYGRHGNARCKYTRRSILLNSGANVQPLPHSHIYSLAFIISAHEHFLKMFSSDSLRFVKKLSKK